MNKNVFMICYFVGEQLVDDEFGDDNEFLECSDDDNDDDEFVDCGG